MRLTTQPSAIIQRSIVKKGYFLPSKMQINIYPHKVLRYFKCHHFKRISQLEKDLAPVLRPGGIPINFGSVSVYKGETNEN